MTHGDPSEDREHVRLALLLCQRQSVRRVLRLELDGAAEFEPPCQAQGLGAQARQRAAGQGEEDQSVHSEEETVLLSFEFFARRDDLWGSPLGCGRPLRPACPRAGICEGCEHAGLGGRRSPRGCPTRLFMSRWRPLPSSSSLLFAACRYAGQALAGSGLQPAAGPTTHCARLVSSRYIGLERWLSTSRTMNTTPIDSLRNSSPFHFKEAVQMAL